MLPRYGTVPARRRSACTRMNTIDPKTRVCGIIGKPLGHSLSPAIHNAGYRELGLNFVYVAFEVDDAAQAVAGMRGLDIRGLSVTIPHKSAVIPHLDRVEEIAGGIGAVNTIVNEDGNLTGYNTDGTAALRALEEAGISCRGKPVLVLGSGGAARAVAFTLALKSDPSHLRILGIIPEELRELADDLREKTGLPVEDILLDDASLSRALPESAVLINASPVGMHPNTDTSLVPPEFLHPELSVFDVVYNPDPTRLLQDARSRGLPTASGLRMFLYQAADQFTLFTGHPAPLELMERMLRAHFTGSP